MVIMPKKTAISPKEEIPLGQVIPPDQPLIDLCITDGQVPDIETSLDYVRCYGRKDEFLGVHHVGAVKPFRTQIGEDTFERVGVEYGQAVYRQV